MKGMTTVITSSPPSWRITCGITRRFSGGSRGDQHFTQPRVTRIRLVALVPDDDLVCVRCFKRHGQQLDGREPREGPREVFRQGCHELSAREHEWNLEQSLRGGPYIEVRTQQAARQLFEWDGMTAGPTKHVRQVEILLFGNGITPRRVVFCDGTEPAHRSQVDDAQRFRELAQPEESKTVEPDEQVGIAVFEPGQGGFREVLDVAANAGRLPGETLKYNRHDPQQRVGRYDQGKG